MTNYYVSWVNPTRTPTGWVVLQKFQSFQAAAAYGASIAYNRDVIVRVAREDDLLLTIAPPRWYS